MHWELPRRSNLHSVVHYLDDFMFVGSASSSDCMRLMRLFEGLCLELGVPIALEKTEGPTHCLTFLGLGIDTVSMTIFVPEEKVKELVEKIYSVLE